MRLSAFGIGIILNGLYWMEMDLCCLSADSLCCACAVLLRRVGGILLMTLRSPRSLRSLLLRFPSSTEALNSARSIYGGISEAVRHVRHSFIPAALPGLR